MIDLAETALVVVDMQNDFCDERGYYGSKGLPIQPVRTALPALARLLATVRARRGTVIFTRMVHDPRVADVMRRHRLLPAGWVADEPRLVPGTWGAEIVDELRPLDDEVVFNKADYSAFYQTGLEAHLRRSGVRTLLLGGAIDHACVLHTAFDAFCRDFDVVIARECVSGWYPELGQAALRMVELLLGRVVPLHDVIQDVSRRPAAGTSAAGGVGLNPPRRTTPRGRVGRSDV